MSTSPSRLEAHAGFFRLSLNEKFDGQVRQLCNYVHTYSIKHRPFSWITHILVLYYIKFRTLVSHGTALPKWKRSLGIKLDRLINVVLQVFYIQSQNQHLMPNIFQTHQWSPHTTHVNFHGRLLYLIFKFNIYVCTIYDRPIVHH